MFGYLAEALEAAIRMIYGSFKCLSNNANLSALTLSTGTLTPAFSSATTNYTAIVSTNSITVTPTAAQAGATIRVRVNGGSYSTVSSGSASPSLSLNTGSNTVEVQVTAENGVTVKTYSITVILCGTITAELSGGEMICTRQQR